MGHMNDRSLWVDYAKGIGIVLVVYGHVARGVHSAGLPMDEQLFQLIDSVIYSFHMPLFFFVSGLLFVGSLQRQGGLRLVATKLDTVAYPYIIWSVIQGGTEALLSQFTNGNVTVGDVAALLWQPRAQFWFLYALFFVFLLATPIYRRLDARWHFAIFAAAAGVYVFRDGIPGGVPLNFIYQYFVFFSLGIFVGPLIPRLAVNVGKLLGVSAIAFAAFQFALHGSFGQNYTTPHNLLALMLAVVSILAVMAISMQLAKAGPGLLAGIGNASMGIYLMHILAGSGVRIVLQKFMGIDSAAVHLVLGTIAGVGLPLLMLRTINDGRLAILLKPPRWLSMSAIAGRYRAGGAAVASE
jgi:fucose 4-O-acetylase-like acetyltransferase